jgi:thiamine pyrophosphate-dependent acetolactate synthase large subunit-like protein
MFAAEDMLRSFQRHRENSIVIVTGTGGRHWGDISTNEKRDVPLAGAMGQTTSAALGLALAQPNEKVVLFDSEGSLLMNMGILATIAGQKPSNFVHFLMDNECYATTGGQPVPNSQGIDYAGMAEKAGYSAAYHFDNLEDFATNVGKIMSETGPVFVSMKVVPEIENEPIGRRQRGGPVRPRAQVIRELQEDLGIAVS